MKAKSILTGLLLCLVMAAIALAPSMATASKTPTMQKHMKGLSDEALYACACPGAVAFCTEWKQKWAKDVRDPRIRNQSVRECVIDFMGAVTGRPWPP